MKYPYRFIQDGNVLLTLRNDEVYEDEAGITHMELGDAFERLFWEMSNAQLEDLKVNGKKLGFPSSLVNSVDRILSQRKFMQDNQSFRMALSPK